MLNEKEAQDLMYKLLDLRAQFAETHDPKVKTKLKNHETLCMDKFRYLVTMRTNRYKSFPNYDDLNQEGFEALLKAMKTFKKNKGCWFSWAHKYIALRISRSANTHTAIRYPLKVAKEIVPHKETIMPIQIEEFNCPDKKLEESQTVIAIRATLDYLPDDHKEIVKLFYGLNGDKPTSINKICHTFGISRMVCIQTIENALIVMRENIKL
jgi:RNA polymerase sigma factor (sigma-70 family)